MPLYNAAPLQKVSEAVGFHKPKLLSYLPHPRSQMHPQKEKIMNTRIWMGLGLSLLTLTTTSHAQVIDKKALSLAAANKIAAAAEAAAQEKNARVVIAVVDDGGHLLV